MSTIPTSKLRTHPVLGMRIVSGLRGNAADGWTGGTIYDPESGSSYHCKASVEPGGNRMDLRGYIGFSLLGRTEVWTRWQPPQPRRLLLLPPRIPERALRLTAIDRSRARWPPRLLRGRSGLRAGPGHAAVGLDRLAELVQVEEVPDRGPGHDRCSAPRVAGGVPAIQACAMNSW